MKTVVCIRFCPDVTQLRADPESGAPRFTGVPLRVSTLDEHALEQAVRVKERHGGQVIAVTLVPRDPPQELMLKVLAMGVDELVLLIDDRADAADALATAVILGAALCELSADLLLFGEGSIDRFDQQVGPRVAEVLDLPSVTYVSKLEIDGDKIIADRILEDRIETVRCCLPAVVTVGHESAVPRLPSVLQVLAASRKPRWTRNVRDMANLGGQDVATLARTRTLRVAAPFGTRRRIEMKGEGPDEMAHRLVRCLLADGALKS